jgi:hypothetical protein
LPGHTFHVVALDGNPVPTRSEVPLLREVFVAPGWVGDDAFLAGYGALCSP